MSALRPRNLAPADLSALVTDPDLSDAEARLGSVLATRASQASVDSLGSTLGPAIVSATADKATAEQVAALIPSGTIQLINRADGQPSPGWSKAGGVPLPGLPAFASPRLVVVPYDPGPKNLAFYALYQPVGCSNGGSGHLQYYAALANVRVFNANTGAWSDLPTTTANSFTALVATPTHIVQFGGASGSASTVVRVFDIATQTWSTGANHPVGVAAPADCALADGRALSVGGRNGTLAAANLKAEVCYYSPTDNTWTVAPTPFPARLSEGRAVQRPDGKVYVYGLNTSDGVTLAANSRRTWLLDITTGAATECDPWPTAASPNAFYALSDGRLKVSFYGTVTATNNTAVLDPSLPPGSQWSFVEGYYDAVHWALSRSNGCLANGMVPVMFFNSQTSLGVPALICDDDALTRADPLQTFYQIKD